MAVVTEQSKLSCFKFKQRQRLRSQVRIPAQDYGIDCSEVEILCCYSNSRVLGDMCRLQNRTQRNTILPKNCDQLVGNSNTYEAQDRWRCGCGIQCYDIKMFELTLGGVNFYLDPQGQQSLNPLSPPPPPLPLKKYFTSTLFMVTTHRFYEGELNNWMGVNSGPNQKLIKI